MSLTTPLVVSRALVLIAVGACLPLALSMYVIVGFSGPLRTPLEWAVALTGFTLWIPIAVSWKHPYAGYTIFMAVYTAVLAICVVNGGGVGKCIYGLVFPTISAVVLTCNVLMLLVTGRAGDTEASPGSVLDVP